MAKLVELGNGRIFPTQKAATEFFQEILNSGKQKITKTDPEYSDLLALYKRHPEFESKSIDEDNIAYFVIKNSDQFGTICFHATHHDETEADWSLNTAIVGRRGTRFEDFRDAARHALEEQVHRFRDNKFKMACEKFLEERGYTDQIFPDSWVTQSEKLQYRASLLGDIKQEFVDWYNARFITV